MAFLGSNVQSIFGNDLLTLTQGDIVKVFVVDGESKFLPELFHVLEWVYPRTEDKENRCSRASLLV